MKVYRGIPAAAGMAIGRATVWGTPEPSAVSRTIRSADVAGEKARLARAVERAQAELRRMAQKLPKTDPGVKLLLAQQMMVTDPEILKETEAVISSHFVDAATAYRQAVERVRSSIAATANTYLRDRANDLAGASSLVLKYLSGGERLPRRVKPGQIVLACNLSPGDVLTLCRQQVRGLVSETGGATSHAAILAKAWGIPAVMGLVNVTKKLGGKGSPVIVDGGTGKVIINPDSKTREEFERRSKREKREQRALLALRRLPAVTRDGHRVRLSANLDFPEETEAARRNGAEGVGLFRTEYLLTNQGIPTEEEQSAVYRKIVRTFAPHPVTLRTFDVGGDKFRRGALPEANPFLGWRAIRIGLDEAAFLATQLRAMLRASTYGRVRILLPMVATVAEVTAAQKIFAQAKQALQHRNVRFDPETLLGIMIEIPAAALVAEHLAAQVDFFSIGTNDLAQYTLAVDRGNPKVAHLFDPFDPSVLRLLAMSLAATKKQGIEVSVCGEMAADPLAVPLLIGLGVQELSVVPALLPGVKRLIRELRFADLGALASEVLEQASPGAVKAILRRFLEQIEKQGRRRGRLG